jgi:AcrR family transcriptional regulator
MPERSSVPRGRHAPPLEVRQDLQRRRLNQAAAAVFSRMGYADASAEAIAREAGMSKATFYEHFDNKEDCICALFDTAATDLLGALQNAAGEEADPGDPLGRYRPSIRAFLERVAENPEFAQTLLVEIIGAGPRAMERRDRVLAGFADYIYERTAADADAGLVPRMRSRHDAFAVVGAFVELASRQLRLGTPDDIRELEPVIERIIRGLMSAAETQPAGA